MKDGERSCVVIAKQIVNIIMYMIAQLIFNMYSNVKANYDKYEARVLRFNGTPEEYFYLPRFRIKAALGIRMLIAAL